MRRNWDYAIRVKKFSEAKVIRRAVDRNWIDQFRAWASVRLGELALFMFTTGARVGEAMALEPPHLDLDNKAAILPTSKTGDPRVFYLTDEMVAVLRALPRATHFGRGRLKVLGWSSRSGPKVPWRKVCERAQIPYRMMHEAGRHSFATEALIRRGIDPVTTARLGGWRNPTLLMRTYAHAEDLGAIAEKVFGRADG
jgi:integrase